MSRYRRYIKAIGEFQECFLSDIEGAPFFVPPEIRAMEAYVQKVDERAERLQNLKTMRENAARLRERGLLPIQQPY